MTKVLRLGGTGEILLGRYEYAAAGGFSVVCPPFSSLSSIRMFPIRMFALC